MYAMTTTSPTEITPASDVPTRTLASWATPRDYKAGHSLESVRDTLRAQRRLEMPDDIDRLPSSMHIGMDRAGAMTITPLHRSGRGSTMTLSPHAARQLAGRLLPSRGLGFMRALAPLGLDAMGSRPANPEAGTKLATMAWNTFAHQRTSPLMYRVVSRGAAREVRAVLSQGYATYDCLEFVDDVLGALGRDAGLFRVIDWRIDQDAMRVRMVGGSEAALEQWQAREINKPNPMVELWNSEVGRRSVQVKSGTYTLWCANGCGHWDKRAAKWRWNHTGRTSDRIKTGVAGAIEEALVASNGIAAAYTEALGTAIDDAFGWFENVAGDDLTNGQVEAVGAALRNEPTVNGGGRLLASVVDAVTYVAHEQASMWAQEKLERVGGELLNRGLTEAEGGRIRVDAIA